MYGPKHKEMSDPFSISSGLALVQWKLSQICTDPNMTLVTSSPVFECFLCGDSRRGCTKDCKRIEKYRARRNGKDAFKVDLEEKR